MILVEVPWHKLVPVTELSDCVKPMLRSRQPGAWYCSVWFVV